MFAVWYEALRRLFLDYRFLSPQVGATLFTLLSPLQQIMLASQIGIWPPSSPIYPTNLPMRERRQSREIPYFSGYQPVCGILRLEHVAKWFIVFNRRCELGSFPWVLDNEPLVLQLHQIMPKFSRATLFFSTPTVFKSSGPPWWICPKVRSIPILVRSILKPSAR